MEIYHHIDKGITAGVSTTDYWVSPNRIISIVMSITEKPENLAVVRLDYERKALEAYGVTPQEYDEYCYKVANPNR